MKPHLPVRLVRQSQIALERLVRRLRWSPSRVVREGLRLLLACYPSTCRHNRIIGAGKFKSGISDLASNKAHLKGFGQRSYPGITPGR
jgi:hypothetical protein